ncbi:hypothetical protein ACS0TY_014076 [Phlomoides rotata]
MHSPPLSSFCNSPSKPSFSESVMGRGLDIAEAVIMKWNPEITPVASLFRHNRRQVLHFIQTVNNLQKAMHFLLEENSCRDQLARARNLMQIADLRVIAECMISSGYVKECLKIYKIVRKSVVDEGIYKLGVERISSSRIH